jgi:hypothetical protein
MPGLPGVKEVFIMDKHDLAALENAVGLALIILVAGLAVAAAIACLLAIAAVNLR